jgi:CO dehydrogenase maturation factor
MVFSFFFTENVYYAHEVENYAKIWQNSNESNHLLCIFFLETCMSKVIAFAGKGGVGKTTVASLVIRYMSVSGKSPVLAVDADPNSNLGETIGLEVPKTIGDIRETYMKDPQGIPSGMDKINYLQLLVEQALIERPTFDLLVMGRQEGQGCYCMVNNILNNFTDKLSAHYKYMIVDNEAGMEHLSRRTSGRVDMLYLVTDYSLRGLRAVRRIHSMLKGLKLDVKNLAIVVTRGPEKLSDAFLAEVAEIGLPIAGVIPNDAALLEFDMERRSLLELPDDSLSVLAVKKLMDEQCPVL